MTSYMMPLKVIRNIMTTKSLITYNMKIMKQMALAIEAGVMNGSL